MEIVVLSIADLYIQEFSSVDQKGLVVLDKYLQPSYRQSRVQLLIKQVSKSAPMSIFVTYAFRLGSSQSTCPDTTRAAQESS